MSDAHVPTPAPRPVGFFTILMVFVSLAVFAWVARYAYLHHRAPATQNEAPENLSKDQQWRATPELRRAYLVELKDKQSKQLGSYGWVDQKNGIVQVPLERAKELVIQDYASK